MFDPGSLGVGECTYIPAPVSAGGPVGHIHVCPRAGVVLALPVWNTRAGGLFLGEGRMTCAVKTPEGVRWVGLGGGGDAWSQVKLPEEKRAAVLSCLEAPGSVFNLAELGQPEGDAGGSA